MSKGIFGRTFLLMLAALFVAVAVGVAAVDDAKSQR